MILRRYGSNVESVETNFDSRALNEIGFRRDHVVSIPANEFFDRYERLSGHDLTAQAEGDVQDEVESAMLDELQVQLSALEESLEEGHSLFVESEQGRNYPKTTSRQRHTVVEGENRLYFYSNIDPPLRIAIYRPVP